MNVNRTAVTLTVNWNWRNFLTASLTVRPHLMALTILPKLSSMRITSDASLATSVPAIPIEKPISASLSAGASLVPSPVTATVSSKDFRNLTSFRLSCGDDLARTRSLGTTLLSSKGLSFRNSGPSMTISSSLLAEVKIPQSRAMARAVLILSPVTIRTTTPAVLQSATACLTPGRRGSLIPTRVKKVMSLNKVFSSSA
ncbi:hypothetical protein AWJ20_3886 [Sugiyamaella lignohabitans]|uniref:Uncharacterized protein n=1 Tax=Sugiyamaella lignohabitans TaxID=796027 RepID=A0A167C164_9ASCO|nr:uncharacterized protein AWJ20_3886 [Sugiyamaella lignohabitans]ANB11090.1 hypothetical protein AWJ20_3886 [Sugiyamaella lignohabitans]